MIRSPEKIKLKKSGDKPHVFKFTDQLIENLFAENESLVKNDPVFKKIFLSLNNGWNELQKARQNQVLALVRNLIVKLKEYHDSYINLKSAALHRHFFDDEEKYHQAVENADRREMILHNSFLDQINILSRKMNEAGLDNSWRKDPEVYGLTPGELRLKAKTWMFKIFQEKIS